MGEASERKQLTPVVLDTALGQHEKNGLSYAFISQQHEKICS
jgi:hypothetical protein